MWELSVLSAQFFCKLKTTLENKIFKNTEKKDYREIQQNVSQIL